MINPAQVLSPQLGDDSKSANSIQFTIRKVALNLDELKRKLAKPKTHLARFGNAYADFEQDIEHLTA